MLVTYRIFRKVIIYSFCPKIRNLQAYSRAFRAWRDFCTQKRSGEIKTKCRKTESEKCQLSLFLICTIQDFLVLSSPTAFQPTPQVSLAHSFIWKNLVFLNSVSKIIVIILQNGFNDRPLNYVKWAVGKVLLWNTRDKKYSGTYIVMQ